jgi:hypothetical protein
MASQEDVERARREAEIAKIRHESIINTWTRYFGFLAKKIVGVGCSLIGSVEVLAPEVISATIPEPEAVLSVGIALLFGRSAIKIAAKVNEAIEK